MPQPERNGIVSVRRRSPVALTVRERRAAAQPVLEVWVGAHRVATILTTAARAAPLGVLLTGPAWLLVVAADVHADLLGRVWALVPAEGAAAELGDHDLVYAVPLGSVHCPGPARRHPGDLLAEARRLLSELAGVGDAHA